uniref:Uncharacterized protein n=1 Tax=Trichuris muris TaxID=70415 RepID=A0A5S6QLU2_TRIMR
MPNEERKFAVPSGRGKNGAARTRGAFSAPINCTSSRAPPVIRHSPYRWVRAALKKEYAKAATSALKRGPKMFNENCGSEQRFLSASRFRQKAE